MSTESTKGPLLSDKTAWQVTRPLVHSAIACIVVDTLIVLAKTYSRVRLARLRFWWDDFWIVAAYALLVPISAIGIAMVRVEVAWDNEDRVITNLAEDEILLKCIYALLQFLLATFAATRYSILALYLRIFSERRLRQAIWAMIGFVTVQWLAFALTSVFQCIPVQAFWNRRLEGKCVGVDTFYRSITPFNIFVDAVLVIMPLPTVWRLKASNMRKWALTFIFSIGVTALIVSAIRLDVYMTHTATYIAPSLTNVMIMWIVIEPSIYLIAACLPAMHHIVAAAVPRKLSSWMAERMARFSNLRSGALSRSRTGNLSLASDTGVLTTGHEHQALELGDSTSAAKSSARAAPGDETGVDWRMLNSGIVVTKEVHVTYSQEERISQIIGF